MYFWELPATIIIIFMIDSKQWGGRKRMVLFGLILYVLSEFLIYKFEAPMVVIGMTLIRVADKLVWLSLHQLKLESYLTYYRTLGVGMAESIGKFAACFSSFIVFSLFDIDPYLPFLFFGCLSLITICLVSIFPKDLT
jgi:hypothetical protein